ncbi:MAG: S8 family serine peptidase [Microbacterium sp.]|uniref:S8 family serine peptidase n=1 Tax=Microbacterium sp. TaxID=51671 RepID=UPI002726E8EA|nr:S8 family serine peptidase [Microbacterium sp.]MDO8382972.1 S8 family serine peptidase [Microbacterium sp.]
MVASGPSTAVSAACTPPPAAQVAEYLGIDELAARGITGDGVTIGVISTSFDNSTAPTAMTAAQDIVSGALPGIGNPCGWETPVEVLHDDAPSDDEGRAMLQIVHAIAPAARLVFTSANSDEVNAGASDDESMANAIDALVAAGADIIVDDIMLVTDTAYAAGLAAAAADRAAASGVAYVVAAGNLGHVGADTIAGVPQASGGYQIAGWQTSEFRAISCPVSVVAAMAPDAVECMDFDPESGEDVTARYTIYVEPGQDSQVDATLQWSDQPYAVTSELYGFFLDESGTLTDALEPELPVVAGLPMALGLPFAGLPDSTAITRDLVIARVAGPALTEPLAVRFAFWDDNLPRVVQAAEYYQSTATDVVGSTLIGRAANRSALAVAAQPFADPAYVGCPGDVVVECFSSTGPQARYYAPLDGTTPPARLSTPETRNGPTITGLDGIPTTFFDEEVDGTWLFYGTSAATPVVGAVLALGMQVAPTATIGSLVDSLLATASALQTPWNGTTDDMVVGAGLVHPSAFIDRLAPTPSPSPSGSGAAAAVLAESGDTTPVLLVLLLGGALLVLGTVLVVGRRRKAVSADRV